MHAIIITNYYTVCQLSVQIKMFGVGAWIIASHNPTRLDCYPIISTEKCGGDGSA